MGVIKRQGIKQSIVNYAGVFLAAFNTIFIYSLDTELYGAARFIIDTAFLLTPFILLGATSVAIKYFPVFKSDDNKHYGFLGLLSIQLFLGITLVSLIGLIGIFIYNEEIMKWYSKYAVEYSSQFYKIAILAVIISFFNLLYSYTSNFKRIVVPSIFLNLIKLSLPVFVLLYYYGYITFALLTDGILGTYLMALAGILLYLNHLGQLFVRPSFALIDRPLFKQISSFAAFSLFSGIGSMLAFRIDSIMVSTLLDFQNNGVYTISLFIGNAIAIPTGAILQIASPIVADAINRDDFAQVDDLYAKSSLNLLVFGVLFFTLVMSSILDLFALMPGNDFNPINGYYIVLTIGLAKLLDMATSINSQIINYSKYYRFNVVAILLMALINIILNLILIPSFQVVGAAMATFLSLTLYNMIKVIFIYIRFGIQPFSMPTLAVLLIGTICFGLTALVPDTGHAISNIILKSVLLGGLYILLVIRFKVSEEFNKLWIEWRSWLRI